MTTGTREPPRPLIVLPTAGPRDARPGLSGMPPGALEQWLRERGQPGYRGRQVSDWLWSGNATAAHEMRTLPAALRAEIEAAFRVDSLTHTDVHLADAGLTEKALHRLSDGRLVESV